MLSILWERVKVVVRGELWMRLNKGWGWQWLQICSSTYSTDSWHVACSDSWSCNGLDIDPDATHKLKDTVHGHLLILQPEVQAGRNQLNGCRRPGHIPGIRRQWWTEDRRSRQQEPQAVSAVLDVKVSVRQSDSTDHRWWLGLPYNCCTLLNFEPLVSNLKNNLQKWGVLFLSFNWININYIQNFIFASMCVFFCPCPSSCLLIRSYQIKSQNT